MKRALVLGGGGVVGVAWESGLVAGLAAAGVDLRAFDAIVGTSAGALVGSQIARGVLPESASALLPDGASRSLRASIAALPGASFIDPGKVDVQALGEAFALWGKMKVTTREEVAAIGAIAARVHRDGEALWVEQVATGFGAGAWPERTLLIVAVDTGSGERRVFDRHGGVDLARALAASSAVPALFPSVAIDGALYMDGQVHSSTNADVLLSHAPEQVWIAMPTNGLTARGIGRNAERALAAEVELLRQAGCTVHVTTPGAADAERIGPNLMDAGRIHDAYATGIAAGTAWAADFAAS